MNILKSILLLVVLITLNTVTNINTVYAMDTYDYVVIGGGAAGIAAARTFRDNNYSVLILEGNTRYGGRVYSYQGPSGFPYPVELGGAWVHHQNVNPMYNLTLQSGLGMMLFDQGNSAVFDSGKLLSQTQVNKFVGRYLAYYAAADAFRANNISDEYAFALAGYFGGDNRIETTIQFFEEQWAGNNTKYHNSLMWDNRTDAELGPDHMIPTGYIKLFDYLLDRSPSIRSNLKLNSIATNINYQGTDGTVIVTYTNYGQVYQVKALYGAVVTVSLGVLRNNVITFNPPLPQAHVDSINKLMFSAVNKVALFFNSTGEDLLNGNKLEKNYMFRIPYGATPRYDDPLTCFINWEHVLGQPVITSFFQGDASHAYELLTDAEIISKHMVAIRDIIPDMPDPMHYVVTRWGQDPFFYGSWTDFAVGSTEVDLNQLAVPLGVNNNVMLAGEASNWPDQGTVYSAYISGISAANYLMT